nr:C4-dicarboxylate TRAP transporter substrate-binding protein [uncultured Caproiciproducens sp.]
MKRTIAAIISLALMVVTFSGCGGTQKAASSTAGTTSSTGSTAAAAKTVQFQIAYENNPGEPIDEACQKWKSLIEQKSNGSIKVELFPSSQLGNKSDLIDQMIAGAAVCTIADGAFYAERGVPDFGIVFAPYLFDSWDECWKLTKSDWYAEQSKKLEENGLKILASDWIYGDRQTLTKKPVHTPSDMAGMKIRVANSPVFIKGFQALGATPTPMALGDVYTALQQGTIDGLENPLTVLYNGKYQEVAKYLVLDGHVKNFTTWAVGTKFFNSLTEDQRNLLVATGNEAGLINNDLQEKSEATALEKLKADGVTVYEPTAAEKAEFKKAALKFYDYPEITGKWTPGLYDTVSKILKS